MLTSRAADGSTTKMECLEAIRGLAAVSVVVGHLVLGFWPALCHRNGPRWDVLPSWVQAMARFPGKFLLNGEMAVSIFFVLSGFVLSLSYFQRGSPSALGSAAVRRYPRLMIPITASILLAYALLAAGLMRSQDAVRHMDQLQGLTLDPAAAPGHSNNWLRQYYPFAPHFATALREGVWTALASHSSYNLVLWTMPIELNGSLLVFGFLALCGGLRNRWLLYGVAGGLLLAHESYYLLDFVLGMSLCDAWAFNQRTSRRSLPLVPALAGIVIGLFMIPWKPVGALLIVGAAVASPRVQEILSTRWLAFLGRLSFGLYLLHMPIFCSLGCGLYLQLCRELGWSHASASLLASAASFTGSIFAAWAFYHAVDRPTLHITRRFDAWLFRPTVSPKISDNSPVVPVARAA